MTVVKTERNAGERRFAITSEFEVPPETVWHLWANPRLLERWWGPPGFPATFVDHNLHVGGLVSYYMTGPDGERYHGWWRVVGIDAPRALSFDDGFADDTGKPNPDLPVTRITVSLEGRNPVGTTMVIESHFPSREAMEQLIGMGMEEGMALALGQADALLADV